MVLMKNLVKCKGCNPILDVFAQCAEGIVRGKLITRESRQDKEFHFQNWFKTRLGETGLNFEVGGRNSYPDFRLVASTGGFEVKGTPRKSRMSARMILPQNYGRCSESATAYSAMMACWFLPTIIPEQMGGPLWPRPCWVRGSLSSARTR